MNTTHPDELTIEQAAKAAGLSTQALRKWEWTLGWPCPRRQSNGYRVFTRSQVLDIVRIAKLISEGFSARQLIVDGMPRWPGALEVPVPRWSMIEHLPMPSRRAELCRGLTVTAAQHRSSACLLLRAHATPNDLRPVERRCAGWLPIEMALQEWERVRQPLPRTADIRAAMRLLAGRDWHAVPEMAAAAAITAEAEG